MKTFQFEIVSVDEDGHEVTTNVFEEEFVDAAAAVAHANEWLPNDNHRKFFKVRVLELVAVVV